MRCLVRWALVGVALGAASCKDPETQAAEQKVQTEHGQISEGRRALAAGAFDRAIASFQAASSTAPTDPAPFLLLSEAQHESGNDDAAILALKQAQAMTRLADPSLKKQLADLYEREGYDRQAVEARVELRDLNQLEDSEVLHLALEQARLGKPNDALKTLDRVQSARPDDPEAKVVQAEILMGSGDEADAAKIADRLLAEQPELVSARLLRARSRLYSNDADGAESDIDAIKPPDSTRADVVQLKARILTQLTRYDEAEAALSPLLEADPNAVDVMAQLADVKLSLGETSDADVLLDKALGLRPRSPRALYVRGRALEIEGDLPGATSNYKQSIKADPTFGPALSRMWKLYQQQGLPADMVASLERLYFANEASTEEKVALAQGYLSLHGDIALGRKIMTEVARREPQNAEYRQLLARLGGGPVKAKHAAEGPVIIRGHGAPKPGERRRQH